MPDRSQAIHIYYLRHVPATKHRDTMVIEVSEVTNTENAFALLGQLSMPTDYVPERTL